SSVRTIFMLRFSPVLELLSPGPRQDATGSRQQNGCRRKLDYTPASRRTESGRALVLPMPFQDLPDRSLDDVQALLDLGVRGGQRQHELEHVVLGAGGFHEQPALETGSGDFIRQLRLFAIDAQEQA